MRSSAERSFIAFLGAHPSATPEDFEAFCRERPEQEPGLRRLYESWLVVESLRLEASSRRDGSEGEGAGGAGGPGGEVTLASNPPDASRTGERILERLGRERGEKSRYSNREFLARGGMGEVLRVWDEDLRRHLAMKVIRSSAGSGSSGTKDREALERFLEEAQVTGQLEHPGVVPVHEMGLDAEGEVYFTMRLVRGDDLKQILPKIARGEDGWSVTRALNVLLRACEAVAYAHSKGVIHRDLKPANIMTGHFGEVYVMDWGLARVLSREDSRDLRPRRDAPEDSALLTKRIETDRARAREGDSDDALVTMDGTVVGTPCYMPPEQAEGSSGALGPFSDVYSLGAILYHVLTGSMPYVPGGKRLSPHLVLVSLLNGPPRPVLELAPDAPPGLVAICEKAMARFPEDRYADAVELAADIQAYLEHRPVSARRHGLGELARLFYERNKPVTWTAGVSGGVLLAALVVFVLSLTKTLGRLHVALAESEELTHVLLSSTLLQDLEGLAITPESLGAINAWLGSVDGLLGERGKLLEERDASETPDDHKLELTKALSNIDRLERGLPRVEEWRDVAETLVERLDGEDAGSWEDAIEEIAWSDKYEGLAIEPQLGLVPLGESPQSGLWEFWLIASGERPRREPGERGNYLLGPESGIVLVLIPGRKLRLGALNSTAQYTVVQTFEIPSFFLAKYEVTQGQWERVMGSNPSVYTAGLRWPGDPNPGGVAPGDFTLLHPVEGVTRTESMEFARRLGVTLPHELYWERAARADTESCWYFGNSDKDIEGNENLAGQEAGSSLGAGTVFAWNDGFPLTAPVGSFSPNGFGLFDINGNVTEWCSNFQTADQFWLAGLRNRGFARGGSWSSYRDASYPQYRYDRGVNEVHGWLGLRVSRELER